MTTATDRLLPLEAVCDQVGIGKTKVKQLIRMGVFPAGLKPFRDLPTCQGLERWSELEIQAWVAARKLAGRSA